MKRAFIGLMLAVPLAVAATGCTTTPIPNQAGEIHVVAAFYPLQYAAQTIGGDSIEVRNLTSPGVEPHDLELSPAQVAAIADADLVLYVKGFQPAVDEAVAQQASDHSIDLGYGLDRLASLPGAAGTADSSNRDPHIWLDPANLTMMATAINTRLREIDPSGTATFNTNLDALAAQMSALSSEFTAGLANCRSRALVTSHAAFAYLAKAFNLTQVGISGLHPDAEPSPARIAEISALVKAQGITTIYYETLVSPKVAQTLAAETGANATVLDPLEGLAEGRAATYPDVMRQNLAALVIGQGCT